MNFARFEVLGERQGAEIEKPGRNNAAAPPDFGDIGEIQGEALGIRQPRIGLAAQDVETLGISLHQAIFDAVVDHLDEMSGARRSRVDVAMFGAGIARASAGRPRDGAKPRRQGLENRIEVIYGRL